MALPWMQADQDLGQTFTRNPLQTILYREFSARKQKPRETIKKKRPGEFEWFFSQISFTKHFCHNEDEDKEGAEKSSAGSSPASVPLTLTLTARYCARR